MSVEVLTILVLVLIFIIGTARSVNLGVLGLVAAFAVGGLAVGMTTEDIFGGFPVDLFIALVGLTFLFGFAQRNGTVDLLVKWGLQVVRGKVAAAPWIFFVLTGLLMSIGAIFAIACVAPLAIPFARRYKIDQLMMGMMVVHGGMAGAFSPLSVYGVFVNGYLESQDLPVDHLALFTTSFAFNTGIALLVYFTMGGRKLLGGSGAVVESGYGEPPQTVPASSGKHRGRQDLIALAPESAAETTSPRSAELSPYQFLTLAGLVAMIVGTAAFGVDIGVISMTVAAVLAIVDPDDAKAALTDVSWSTVVLVGGVLTYINVLETAGTVEFASHAITGLGTPLLAILLLCYLSGIVSALASSIGTIGVAVAIAAPLMASGELGVIGAAAALSISATIVDVSPFSTNGALVLANVDAAHREAFYKRMLVYAGLVVLLAPLVAWTFVFLPI
ncbi:transporter, UIT1 family (TC 9.B.48) [Saccharopolyspora kobensis]|uniref:Transporter, UIT1 family n=1 Tax=Saccharopolyspora kobensis TaxID=146035 RepID=A0A1H5V5B3_9PSEU|nr:SLC13 family permease [Saccharopolyspora kobensis]SEF81637.1 transporter, UIT1 family (TC 9.B.48) [Saccharopolyspora kobensis]SFC66028.1 transporter, UIT1 family [Saccharopolyspora kobensis]